MPAWWWVPTLDGDRGREPYTSEWPLPNGRGEVVRMEMDVMGLPPRWEGQRLVIVADTWSKVGCLLIEDIESEDGA